jgi:hypothetical protein
MRQRILAAAIAIAALAAGAENRVARRVRDHLATGQVRLTFLRPRREGLRPAQNHRDRRPSFVPWARKTWPMPPAPRDATIS